MLYALLFYGREDEWGRLSRTERQRIMEGNIAELQKVHDDGALIVSARLLHTDSATTVRSTGDRMSVLDGPFAETKEQLGGLQIVDCENLDTAIRYAAMHACFGPVEIRPVHPDPGSVD
jgi:hypothetical protein